MARHGETEWNQLRRLQGRLDSPLTTQGIEQAKALAVNLSTQNIHRIISSPLGRALNTAKLCQQELQIQIEIEQELQERHFGDWQDQLFDELSNQANFKSVFFEVTDDSPPSGESGHACGLRIWQSLVKTAEKFPSENLLIITHGDAIRCFLSRLNQTGAVDAYSQYGNGRVFELNYIHVSKEFVLV